VPAEPQEGSPAWVRHAGLGALLVAPAAATLYLSFNAGGFFAGEPAFVAIVAVQLLVMRTVLADRPYEGIRWRVAVPAAGLAGLLAWQLLSAGWSDSTARSLTEANRTLMYLLAFVVMASVGRTGTRLAWAIRATAAAMAFVCLASLLSRVAPDTIEATLSGYADERLNWPLTYWNALGLFAAVAAILVFHLAASTSEPRAIRVIAAGLLPAIGAALMLTFSRGGLGVAAIGVVAYAVLGRPRGLLAALLVALPTVAIAMNAAYDADLLSNRETLGTPEALEQGDDLLRTIVLCATFAVIGRLVLLPLDDWFRKRRIEPLKRVGLPTWSGWVAAAFAVVAIALAAGVPDRIERQYDRFVEGDRGPQAADTRDRLTDPSNGGRVDQWRAAVDAFEDEPLHGEGAGTYQLRWYREREFGTVTDGHSLYLETLGELGVIGFAFVVLAVGGILAGLAAGIRGRDRTRYAALFAAALAWAVAAGLDWHWEMPAVTVWLFGLGGLALAARPRAGPPSAARWRAPVAVAWIVVAVAPLLLMLSASRLGEGSDALAAGPDCRTAKERALDSLDFLSDRPEPYAMIGLCNVVLGFPSAAVDPLERAVAEDPRNWEYHYLLAIGQAAAGRDPRREAAIAQRLNPADGYTRSAVQLLKGTDPAQWRRGAARLAEEAVTSGKLTIHNL
jgi:hypothetical protein